VDKVAYNGRVMLGAATIIVLVQEDHMYWGGEEIQVWGQQKRDNQYRAYAKNSWKLRDMFITRTRKLRSYRNFNASLTITDQEGSLRFAVATSELDETMPETKQLPATTFHLKSSNLDLLVEQLKIAKVKIVRENSWTIA